MRKLDAMALSRALLRGLRGKRSQPALSRRLGYRSNVVYLWESGRRDPAASELFRIVERTGGDPRAPWSGFNVRTDDLDLTTSAGVGTLIGRLRGGARMIDVAERCGVSRYIASRWLRGLTEPRLSELLRLVEVLTLRLFDLVSSLVPADSLPTLMAPIQELETRRRVAFEHPWSQAVLRTIETTAYRARRAHDNGWLARRLGIPVAEVTACLSALREAGLVRFDGIRYESESVAVDTSRASIEERKQLRLHWADVARGRIETGAQGLFSWAVVALSKADYERLREMHVRYMQSLRQLVDASEPSEVVAIANVHLFALE